MSTASSRVRLSPSGRHVDDATRNAAQRQIDDETQALIDETHRVRKLVGNKIITEAIERAGRVKDRLGIGQNIFLSPQAGEGEEQRILNEQRLAAFNRSLSKMRAEGVLLPFAAGRVGNAGDMIAALLRLNANQRAEVLLAMPSVPAIAMELADPIGSGEVVIPDPPRDARPTE